MSPLRVALCVLGMVAVANGFMHTGIRPTSHTCSDSLAVSSRVAQRTSAVVMAVPKKRQSKQKTAQRKAVWLGKTRHAATVALSRAAAAGYDPLEDEEVAPAAAPAEDAADGDDAPAEDAEKLLAWGLTRALSLPQQPPRQCYYKVRLGGLALYGSSTAQSPGVSVVCMLFDRPIKSHALRLLLLQAGEGWSPQRARTVTPAC
eukprot:CAMPEP_0119414660 /NCGR_PEP_ID=MMETSP1335-20130426/7110_1 /TAXON_ID=259385 /ORGANISM="Chrysoculter rhomboideus, Strain RCC1486" /LENGTH=202 /DNA_ID=CAMNT_0007439545 /DNA_START=41 /DNA_END=650 /DNA_ORIENTATION=+